MAFGSVTEYYNSMYASTLHRMGRTVVDQTFQRRPLYFWLSKNNRVTVRGGRTIKIPVQLRESTTATAFGRGKTFDEVDPDYITNATYEWANIGDSLTRYWVDEQENSGESAIINLVDTNIKITVRGVEKKAQAMLVASSPGSNELNGLPYYVANTPTTGTVAGINRANESLWRNQYGAASGSAYTYLLDDLLTRQIACNKYGEVDYIICGETAFKLLTSVVREYLEITDKKMGDAAFAKVGWSGIPATLDTDLTAGSLYMIDSSEYEWTSSYGPKWTEWKEAPNKLDRTAQLVMRAQLLCKKPGSSGVITGIAA